MIALKRGEHLILKDDNIEVVLTDHFKDRFIDKNKTINSKKLLKILKVVVNVYSNYGAGSYDIVNKNNEAVKIKIYKDYKHNINKIDLLSFVNNNDYNLKNDKKIYSNF